MNNKVQILKTVSNSNRTGYNIHCYLNLQNDITTKLKDVKSAHKVNVNNMPASSCKV